ncbi:unnamed protein product, partial [Owenia fusiformis]
KSNGKELWHKLIVSILNNEEAEYQDEDKVNNYLADGYTKSEALTLLYNQFISRVSKRFRKEVADLMLYVHRLLQDDTYKKLMRTAQDLHYQGGYSREESITAAVSLRKHLLNKFFKNASEMNFNE